MKIMLEKIKKLKSTLDNKYNSLLALLAIITISILGGHSAMAWGPERPTFTLDKPADYATFNSITNNPVLGDERNFVRIANITKGEKEDFSDETVLKPGRVYAVYIAYHNDAAENFNLKKHNSIGLAAGVSLSTKFPAKITKGDRKRVSATISAANTKPKEVWDEAYVTTEEDQVFLKYVPASARIYNAWDLAGQGLPTTIFSDEGAPLGTKRFDGVIPGCDRFSGYVMYKLTVEKLDAELTKQVSLDGKNFSDSVEAEAGDTVAFRISFQNTGTMDLNNVVLKDEQDENLSYISGKGKIYNNRNKDTDGENLPGEVLWQSGFSTGTYGRGGYTWITYLAKVGKPDDPCVDNVYNNKITAAMNQGLREAEASVKVAKKECKNDVPPVEPEPVEPVKPDPEPVKPVEPPTPVPEKPVVEIEVPKPKPAVTPVIIKTSTPDQPAVIPQTGPAETAFMIVVGTGIILSLMYLIISRRKLSKMRAQVGSYTPKVGGDGQVDLNGTRFANNGNNMNNTIANQPITQQQNQQNMQQTQVGQQVTAQNTQLASNTPAEVNQGMLNTQDSNQVNVGLNTKNLNTNENNETKTNVEQPQSTLNTDELSEEEKEKSAAEKAKELEEQEKERLEKELSDLDSDIESGVFEQ